MTTLAQILQEIKSEFSGSLNGRTESAARLALAGAVARVNPNTWTVASETTPGESYSVRFHMGWACTCKDFQGDGYHPAPTVEFFGGVQPVCKHIAAAGACWASDTYPAPAAFDLVIATRKRPFTTGSEDYQILWTKKAGEEKKDWAGQGLTLLSPKIQKALSCYELAHTEAQANFIVRRYKLIAGA